jgi:hypothetical protein
MGLRAAGRLLGEDDELGFFSGRLARTVASYPEPTRRGIQVAWVMWLVLLTIAVSPVDPIASRWDEAALGALALVAVWPQICGRRGGR